MSQQIENELRRRLSAPLLWVDTRHHWSSQQEFFNVRYRRSLEDLRVLQFAVLKYDSDTVETAAARIQAKIERDLAEALAEALE